jgi:hypothetical protein
MPKIMVYPASAAALNCPHTIDGPPKIGGSMWEYDGETCRALVEGHMTEDPAKQWKPNGAKAEEAKK